MEAALPKDPAWTRLLDALAPHRDTGLVVAFSGGLDSAILLDAALEALGRERVTAFTAVSPSLSQRELAEARRVAEELGVPLETAETFELDDPGYVANAGNRCYFCKKELFSAIERLRVARGYPAIGYGYHVDDDADVRPGLKAALEAGVVRPLYAAGLGKADLRRLAKARGRSFADKPSQACLSSRLPMGMPVTRERLSKVEIVEGWLKDRGYLQLRARLDKDDLVRLEVAPAELPRLAADLADDTLREALLAEARAAGVTRVTLDLVGYHRAGEA